MSREGVLVEKECARIKSATREVVRVKKEFE